MHHFAYFSIMARHTVTLNEEMEKQIADLQAKENRGSFNNMAVELIRRGIGISSAPEITIQDIKSIWPIETKNKRRAHEKVTTKPPRKK